MFEGKANLAKMQFILKRETYYTVSRTAHFYYKKSYRKDWN